MTLLDTSAIYALASATDENHAVAKATLARLDAAGEDLLVHTYVMLESFALIHRRLGFGAAARMTDEISRLPQVTVDRDLHERGVGYLRRWSGERPSLVDAVSFLVMEDRGIESAFAFDEDFVKAGFEVVGPD